MTRGLLGALLLTLIGTFPGDGIAQTQPSSNPMRRLLRREATPAPTPRPVATAAPVANGDRNSGSSNSSGQNRRSSRAASRNGATAENPAGSSTESQTGNRNARRTPRPTPDPNAALVKSANDATTVVARFLQHANDGRYTQARSLLTVEAQRYFDSEFSAVHGDLMTVLDTITKDGQLAVIRYPLANVRGEGITVVAEMQYRDGSSSQHRFRVVQSGKDYRIALDLKHFLKGPVGESAPVAVPSPSPSNPVSTDTGSTGGTPLTSAASEDILTGSGVVTRPEVPAVSTVLPRNRPVQNPQVTPEATPAPTATPEPSPVVQPSRTPLPDRPWQPATTTETAVSQP